MCEQWCQPFVDCKEKPKYDTVHGVINATNEVALKAKDVNVRDVWTLVKEKEESGTLARNDGIGDEWTFYKLILKLVCGVPDIPQVLLQNIRA